MFIRNSAIALVLGLMAVPASGADLQEAWAGKKKSVELPTGVTVKYVEEGPQNAPPLILLHGLTDSSRSWSMTVPHLAESYHVLVLDQRGHGDSESPQCCYAIPDFAGDVVAFMDTLNIPKATLAGHSMGSFIAEYLAVDSPERVDKLILVGAAASGVGNEWDLGLAFRPAVSGSARPPCATDSTASTPSSSGRPTAPTSAACS